MNDGRMVPEHKAFLRACTAPKVLHGIVIFLQRNQYQRSMLSGIMDWLGRSRISNPFWNSLYWCSCSKVCHFIASFCCVKEAVRHCWNTSRTTAYALLSLASSFHHFITCLPPQNQAEVNIGVISGVRDCIRRHVFRARAVDLKSTVRYLHSCTTSWGAQICRNSSIGTWLHVEERLWGAQHLRSRSPGMALKGGLVLKASMS